MTVFLDSDVILDLLLKRIDHAASRRVFALIENKKIKAASSPVVLTNIFYLITKLKNQKTALDAVRKLGELLEICQIDAHITAQALSSSFTDFEDAVQYYAALNHQADYFLTRNSKDYPNPQIPVINAAGFLQVYKNKS